MTPSRWIGRVKGLLHIVHDWQANARKYPHDRAWQAKCEANIKELKDQCRLYLRWHRNELRDFNQ